MLNVHNIMEEQVAARVNELYDQVTDKISAWITCDCENCRLDTINYVLNRIPPRYVVSGRGVTHNSSLLKDSQLAADIDKLAIEGMRLVNAAKRPYHNANTKKFPDTPRCLFVFPTFAGNIFDGQTFEPVTNASILLLLNGNKASMMDITWPNPSNTYASTEGSFTFWAEPQSAEKEGISKNFTFTIDVTAPDYQETSYSITLPVVSKIIDRTQLDSTFSVKIKDIFLFKNGVKNEQEI
ncbi:late competence development ComFB family protein [Treponema sp.]|uniref:late competence development ComFB family protein n=1 Tax=Treponema sp. TaxID=166 RepID=UPI0025E5D1E9|nr:late competence development ComFB family protein [Treponema sp.]MCR5217327.1 late competence development ComFB family protein [Treponema sp.]